MPRESLRRLQMHSCDVCRRRKIRCDSVDEAPCTACIKSNIEYRFTVGWRRCKRKQPTHTPSASSSQPGDDIRQVDPPSTVPRRHPPQGYRDASNVEVETPRPSVTLQESEVASSLSLAANSLFRFFRDGITSNCWQVFDHGDRMRIAYIGTDISNISHLVRLEQPSRSFLIYPHPPIHSLPSGKPDGPHSQLHDALHNINTFPAKEIRDDFVESFFRKIHPYFPIIDESDFRARYTDSQNQPPLLLMHAVFLAGAHASTHPKAIQARHFVKEVLFQRGKQVFDMRYESDRANLVQAALLFTWHLQNADTASSNSYYWLGVACRIAFGIGLHRNQLNDRMPVSDRRIWRRVWWTLFQVEIMSALEHGRPSMIRLEDFDQEPLTLDDFTESNGVMNSKLEFEYSKSNIELCYIALEVLELSAPRVQAHDFASRVTSLNARLVRWMLRAPNSIDTFGSLHLRLHYYTITIHLCRLTINKGPLPLSPDTISNNEEVLKIASSAATTIVSTLEALDTASMLPQCHFTSVTALAAAAIHISQGIQQSIRGTSNTLLAATDLPLLGRICVVAKKLSEYWPSAEGYRKVFQSLLEKFMDVLNSIEEGTYQDEVFTGIELGVNWIDILGHPWHLDDSYHEQGWEELSL